MRAAALAGMAVVAAAAIAGCGRPEPSQPPAATSLVTVVVWPKGEPGRQIGHVLRCPGDERCARLRTADLSQPKATTACTQLYGGSATALVTGRIEGRQVHEVFDLRDGCQIARWKRLAWLLGAPPGAS